MANITLIIVVCLYVQYHLGCKMQVNDKLILINFLLHVLYIMYCEFNFSIMIFWMESNVKNMTLGISVNTSDCRINKYAMFENTFSRESSFMQKIVWIKSFFTMLFITDLLCYEFESSFMWNKHPEYEHHHMNMWMSGIAHMDLTDYQISCENTIYL